MGRNFFGVLEAGAYFGINPSKQQEAVLTDIPFAERALETCNDTHVLIAVFAFSLLEIRDHCKGTRLFFDTSRYNYQEFAKEKGEVGWQFVCKTPVASSMKKNWNEQKKLLRSDDNVPSVRVMAYTMIGHFRATGKRLFQETWIRCSDLNSDGHRVNVGGLDAVGLVVGNYWDDYRLSALRLAASRKP